MMWRIAFLIPLLSAALSGTGTGVGAEEKKWRWGDGDRSASTREDRELAATRTANDYLSKQPSARYEIFENNEGGNFYNPGRPHDFRPPVDYQQRPEFVGGIRPGRPGGLYGNGYGDGGYGNGAILTGPVPSWQREPPIKEFDRCKCTEKFNCNSPGISYGHCDVGKKYCCYNTQGVQGSPLPSRPHHSLQNGILSGPGGPVDYPSGGVGGRPPYGPGSGVHVRPNQGAGILVGPGGPTGVIGRPPFGPGGAGLQDYRPPHGPGILVGPGGPTGVVGRPGYGGGQGVLVGPGGPTGIIGRPPGGYGGSFGVGGQGQGLLIGPGGPHDRPHGGGFNGGYRPTGFGIGRSAKENTKENENVQNE